MHAQNGRIAEATLARAPMTPSSRDERLTDPAGHIGLGLVMDTLEHGRTFPNQRASHGS
ncbi:MAG: hypothetical protein L0H79_13405 [Intrasporangium sp.]|uniref:hypothetical protein n=1 Tax=Intrasporangium sp. TaxID=1925024 RepID=UPI0026481292|nr:hypothetical protein [Intrasporangium sp.]MDN5796735.1 hypothetical protein [Intrasporangium sp.]